LLIERQDDAWDITVTATIEGRFRKARGTGTIFAQAWKHSSIVGVSWARPLFDSRWLIGCLHHS